MVNKITIENVIKKYDTFQLGELSFEIPKGYITGFIGRNGSGKTTTIKALLSLITIDSGGIVYDSEYNLSPLFLQNIGIIMDEPFLAIDWNMNLINSAMDIAYDQWDSEQFFRYLKRFNISPTLKVKELSRGMKIKLMLAIALSHNAKILILDEPTSGLDASMRDEFTDIMKEFIEDENHTVLFSTHITQDLEMIADYIIFIDDGKLVEFDTKDDFMSKYLIIKGDVDFLEAIPKEIILGKKVSSFGFELLIDKRDIDKLEVVFISEQPTMDKIIALYGRI